jgi:DNA repair protein RecN (Recombination protein N)
MLKLLSVKNFAVVTESSIELGPGLNLLTGETGSGKSIFVDGLGLLLGARASGDVVRTGETMAFVEGVFDSSGNAALLEILDRAGIQPEDGELILRREVSDRGRSRAFANERLVTAQFLRELRPYLVDIYGQGDQQSLLDGGGHLKLIDDFGQLGEQVSRVSALYGSLSAVRRRIAELVSSEASRLREIDILRFQINEIASAKLTPGEDVELEQERRRLENADRIERLTAECYQIAYDSPNALAPAMAALQKRLEELATYDEGHRHFVETLQTQRFILEDLVYFLRERLGRADSAPQRLQWIVDRLHEIERLKHKYINDIAGILRMQAEYEERLESIENAARDAESLSHQLTMIKADYLKAAHELSSRRRLAAADLERAMAAEFKALELGASVFEAAMSVDTARIASDGFDSIAFLISTNKGEVPRPLSRVASGGELSRLMLALKTVSAPPEVPRTLVFDEVDAGIGGRVAEAVGQRLRRLGRAHQVLCVTHQAQIARFADVHYAVRKSVAGRRTRTQVVRLDSGERVDELARMIAGAAITDAALAHARELLGFSDPSST